MYLLYLTICTTLISSIGFSSTECITTTPAKYITESLCINTGKSFVRSINSNTVKAYISCEKV